MKIQVTKKDLKLLIENLHLQFKIPQMTSQQVIDELIKVSERRELNKMRNYAQANYYLPIFGRIYEEILGMKYYPTYGKDNAGLKDVISFLRKHNLDVEGFFAWVCKNKSHVLKKSNLTVLNEFKNEYLSQEKKNEF